MTTKVTPAEKFQKLLRHTQVDGRLLDVSNLEADATGARAADRPETDRGQKVQVGPFLSNSTEKVALALGLAPGSLTEQDYVAFAQELQRRAQRSPKARSPGAGKGRGRAAGGKAKTLAKSPAAAQRWAKTHQVAVPVPLGQRDQVRIPAFGRTASPTGGRGRSASPAGGRNGSRNASPVGARNGSPGRGQTPGRQASPPRIPPLPSAFPTFQLPQTFQGATRGLASPQRTSPQRTSPRGTSPTQNRFGSNMLFSAVPQQQQGLQFR